MNPKKRALLAAYVGCASVTKASRAAGVDRALHYRWLADDPEYSKAFDASRRQAAEVLEEEAVRRAYEGVLEPVVYQGAFQYSSKIDPVTGVTTRSKRPLVVRKYSDGLLQFLLKGFAPDVYGQRAAVEISGPGGGPIAVTDARLAALSDDELAALVDLARKLEGAAA